MAELVLLLRKAKRTNDTKLDLSGKQLDFIHNDVYGLSKLQILNLANNRIETIDEKIEQLSNLKVLDLSDNSLKELPRELLSLKKLEVLVVQNNPLTKQFQPLMDTQLNVQEALRRCFGIRPVEQGNEKIPNWFDKGPQIMRDSKAFGKVVELQGQYKKEKEKVKELQMELQKLSMVKNESGKTFTLDMEAILQIKFSNLQIFEQISMGGFSTIHRGFYKGLKVAVKKNFNPNITDELLKEFSNEISMLAKFRHPNIILLIGICNVPPNLTILTEYIETGSLYDLIHKRKVTLTQENLRSITVQILSSICYLHGHDIMHRDIKSHNFLVDEHLTIKLCDFGLARHKEAANKGPMQWSGTAPYMAQELFMKKHYDQTVDIFALGTLIYEIYTGEIPYQGFDPADIKDRLAKDHTLPLRGSIPKPILEVVNQCRHPQPQRRPTASKLLNLGIW